MKIEKKISVHESNSYNWPGKNKVVSDKYDDGGYYKVKPKNTATLIIIY